MTAVTTYTTPIAAGATVHARAEAHMSTKGGTYQAAVHAVLNADPDLAKAYALPATPVIAKPLRPVAPVVPAPVRLTQGTPGDTVRLRAVRSRKRIRALTTARR